MSRFTLVEAVIGFITVIATIGSIIIPIFLCWVVYQLMQHFGVI